MKKKRRKYQQRRAKRAAGLAVVCYLGGLLLLCGMLRAAQVTRRTLYGGAPVMAAVTPRLSEGTADDPADPALALTLGGGEWSLPLADPLHRPLVRLAAHLPPGMAKYALRLALLAQQAAVELKIEN